MMSCMAEPIRVLLVCRYPLYRLGLRAALGGADAFDEVVDAATGAEALAVAPGLEPHVVVVDSNVVGMLLADLLLRLQQACPSARVLVLVSVTDEHVFGEGVPPAAGYLLRECTGEELLAAGRTPRPRGRVAGVGTVLGTGAAGAVALGMLAVLAPAADAPAPDRRVQPVVRPLESPRPTGVTPVRTGVEP